MNTSRWRFLLKNYDLTSVIQDTIPAEKEYLTILNPSERKAAALAYREIISTLPDIWATRQAHGESQIESVTKEQGRDIDKAMRMLRRIALSGAARGQPDYLVQLTKMWEVQERPFTSTFPLIAPLLSRVREFWNSIATKWYVRQLLHQQNDFNAKVVQELQLLNDQMEMLTTLSQKLDENQLDLMSQVKQLSKRVALLRHSLNELDERMARGETVNNLGADKNLQ
jgi:hypothetical protein